MAGSQRVACGHCGAKIAVPAGHTRAKIRCPSCGYYAEVPPEMRSSEPPVADLPVIAPVTDEESPPARNRRRPAPPPPEATPSRKKKTTSKARANPNPRDPRVDFQIDDDAPLGPNLLEGTQDEDDDKPYAVPGDGMKNCPECHGRIPLDAHLCVHCGVDLQTRRKPKKEYEPIAREWEPNLSLPVRLKIFAGLQILNVLIMVLITSAASFTGGVLSLIFQGALQAFLIGTFQKIAVKRNSKGQTTLTKQWRIAFVPLMPEKIDWKKCHSISVIPAHNMGFLEWITMIYLLLLFILPGVLFYIFVIHPTRYDVILCDQYGSSDQLIYRTLNSDQANEVGEVIGNATRLTFGPT